MNISIFSSFTEIHFEMLGYLIDYFTSSKINFNIYAPISETGLQWKLFYESLFNISINWFSPLTFNPLNYDLIFLLTDDDYGFSEEYINNYASKIVCIDHWGNIRRKPNNCDFFARIGTRFFNNRPQCDWALPCYQIINKLDKSNCLNNTNKINVMCVGIQNRPPSGEFLRELFENFNEIEFNVITRTLHNKYESFNNIKTFENCPTNQMMEMFKNAHYVLCFDNPANPQPINNSISAAIPMSFNFGCKLILPKIWQKYYNFKNVLVYEDTLLQKNNKTTLLQLDKVINLDNIYEELNQLVRHRNQVLDNILKLKFSKLDINRPSVSIYSQMCNFLLKYRPNILVECNVNSHASIINEFREIHRINTNIKLSDEKNIFYYSDDKFKNIICDINENCIFSLNNLDITISDKLSLLSNRVFMDIIFIHNIEHNEDKLKKMYSRQHITYILEKINILVIFPQK